MGGSRKFQKAFQECFKEVSRIFQNVSKKFKVLVRVFQCSSVFESFIVACHSSQLPEQKEGLF